MLSTLRKGCNSFSLNRISTIVRFNNSKWRSHHSPMSSSQETRMKDIIELWDYELERNNAGAFGMQYIVSHPKTRIQNTHILKATSLFQQIMGSNSNKFICMITRKKIMSQKFLTLFVMPISMVFSAVKMPKFSWNTVPVYIHMCNGSGPFNQSTLEYLATFPIVTIEKGI